MLYVYLFTAVAGLLLLGGSLLGGADHDGDGLPDHGGAGAESEHGLSAFGGIASVRGLTYVLAFGGLAGLALRGLAPLGEPWTALLALASGAGAALIATTLLRRALERPRGSARDAQAFVGKMARVLIPPTKEGSGKVRVQLGDSTVDLLATTDDAALEARDEVLIVEVRADSSAHVARSPLTSRK